MKEDKKGRVLYVALVVSDKPIRIGGKEISELLPAKDSQYQISVSDETLSLPKDAGEDYKFPVGEFEAAIASHVFRVYPIMRAVYRRFGKLAESK